MSKSSPPTGAPATAALRAAVAVVLLLTVAAVGVQVWSATVALYRADQTVLVPPLFVPAAITLMAGLALAALVEGVARIAGRSGVVADHDAAAPAVNRLAAAVAELRTALPGLLAELRPPSPAPPRESDGQPVPVDPAVSQLERVVQLLEELKELALLDDAQRQARGQMSKDRRKLERVEEATVLIRHREWEQADALLTLLESLHPGDADVLARRNELDDARTKAREAAWAQVVRQVEDHTALGRFDDAAAAVAAFRQSYPTHVDAAGLAVQVVADREDHLERTATAMFNEIRTAVDARQWRMALDGAQQFLGRFPDHPRSDRIRQQVRTIQKNAEIEERHTQEDRIRELAKGGRFAESADLCQDLLSRFPDSPQAPSLRLLLPRLRERSAMAEAVVE